jgi:protein-S-isoprenylcysteine O-methyltransferase Ste14
MHELEDRNARDPGRIGLAPSRPRTRRPRSGRQPRMLKIAALVELGLLWIAWVLAFSKPREQAPAQKVVQRAPQSRWGIGLVAVSFALVWMYIRPAGFEKSPLALITSMVLGPPSAALAWAATRQLGKQWRYEAALTEDHDLIRTGPYAWVRHPIYTSMFGMQLATAAAWTWWPLFLAAVIFFIVGTEIRVRAEDKLLAQRFGATFAAYRAKVPAFLPFFH